MSRILIAYFSRKGNNYVSGDIVSLPKGNTEIVAEKIQELTGGDLFEIETVKQYDPDYTRCTQEAQEELRAKARPELKTDVENMDDYDVICLGFPNWWGTMPMAVFTFLESHDLSGKKICPFCTNEGSGMGHSEKDIRSLCPESRLERGLALRGGSVNHAGKEIENWVAGLE
ncbi:MAG: flavodoxin [Butyrivibrio sp.]|jgi:flavodoxin|nr:flavodoxin [Butyrivibrio sp.]